MNKLISLMCALSLCFSVLNAGEPADTLSLKRVFANVESPALNILGHDVRLDMLDYAEAGVEYNATNDLYGHSSITACSDSCILVRLTDVSTAQLFTLPSSKGGVAALVYTVDAGAADSKIEFYDHNLRPLKPGRFFRKPDLKDFLAPAARKDKSSLKALCDAIPFIAMRYLYVPEGKMLKVTLTLKGILSREALHKVSELLLPIDEAAAGPSLTYRWDGGKFCLSNM